MPPVGVEASKDSTAQSEEGKSSSTSDSETIQIRELPQTG